jgi:TonB family protein
LLSVARCGLLAQNSTPVTPTPQATPSTPSDAKALMLEAVKLNGLTGDNIKPWHLKATYELLGDDGKPTDQGTYEEFWVSPTKFKRTYTGNNLTQTYYGSEKGEFRSGASQGFSSLFFDARHDLVEPLPSEQAVQHQEFDMKLIDSNGVKIPCLNVTPQHFPGGTYCFSAGQPILRVYARPGESIQILHNRILRFQDHTIPGDLKILRSGKTALSAHVDSIEPLEPVNEADFTPSADAVLQPQIVQIAGGIASGMLLNKVAPEYPQTAKDLHVSGTVVLQAVIDKEGHLRDLKVVSGPKLFQQTSLDAVRQWVYRPYLLNGEPVEVETTINVVYTLGGPFKF